MAFPTLPSRVVSGELITSQWGNLVADELAGTDQIIAGQTPGATVAPGTQTQVASVALSQGVWIVWYQVLISGGGPWAGSLRAFVGGATWSDTYVQGQVVNGSANFSGHITVLADFSAGANTVSVNLVNAGTVPISCYADPANHRLHAMQGRKP